MVAVGPLGCTLRVGRKGYSFARACLSRRPHRSAKAPSAIAGAVDPVAPEGRISSALPWYPLVEPKRMRGRVVTTLASFVS